MSGTSRPTVSVPDLPGCVAHELKNLMSVILGFTEMILRDLNPTDPRREELMEIQRAGERAVILAARIIEMTRSREGT